MWWKEFKFDAEYRNNYQPGEKTYDPVCFNQEQFDFYKKLIHIRKSYPVLNNGKFEFLLAEGSKLVYKRSDGKNEIIVMINAGVVPQAFVVHGISGCTDILSNKLISGDSNVLKPLSAMILKMPPRVK